MWLIIVLLVVAFAFFGFELFQFISGMKRRKEKKKNLSASRGEDKKREEVN